MPSPAFESVHISTRLAHRTNLLTSCPLPWRKHQILHRYPVNHILGSLTRPCGSDGRRICFSGTKNHVEASTVAFSWYTRCVAGKHTQCDLAAAVVPVSLRQTERGKQLADGRVDSQE